MLRRTNGAWEQDLNGFSISRRTASDRNTLWSLSDASAARVARVHGVTSRSWGYFAFGYKRQKPAAIDSIFLAANAAKSLCYALGNVNFCQLFVRAEMSGFCTRKYHVLPSFCALRNTTFYHVFVRAEMLSFAKFFLA
jgi:hypothetical protein